MLQAHAAEIRLGWSENSEASVVGYRVYYGDVSGSYSKNVDSGMATDVTLTGLRPGVVYYAVVSAYDSTGLESSFSEEISFQTPSNAPPPEPSIIGFRPVVSELGGKVLELTLHGPDGGTGSIETTVTFDEWRPFGTFELSGAPLVFEMPLDSDGLPRRFYRIVVDSN